MAAKQTNRAKPAFTHFPKLTTGNDCAGAPIMLGDEPGGCIRRVVEWKDVGGVSASYRPSIMGYTVEVYDGVTDDRTFDTLGEARNYAREFFAKKG